MSIAERLRDHDGPMTPSQYCDVVVIAIMLALKEHMFADDFQLTFARIDMSDEAEIYFAGCCKWLLREGLIYCDNPDTLSLTEYDTRGTPRLTMKGTGGLGSWPSPASVPGAKFKVGLENPQLSAIGMFLLQNTGNGILPISYLTRLRGAGLSQGNRVPLPGDEPHRE